MANAIAECFGAGLTSANIIRATATAAAVTLAGAALLDIAKNGQGGAKATGDTLGKVCDAIIGFVITRPIPQPTTPPKEENETGTNQPQPSKSPRPSASPRGGDPGIAEPNEDEDDDIPRREDTR